MPWPTPNVLGSQFDAKFGRWGGPAGDWLYSPTQLPNLAAWFDALDIQTMLAGDATTVADNEAVALWRDKSDNGGVNALVLNGAAGNYASISALTAFGTGDFSVSSKVKIASLASESTIVGGANNSFGLRIAVTTGALAAYKNGVAALDQATGAVTAFTEAVVGYTRSGTTGTYYVNGVASGVIVDNQDYTVGQSEIGSVAVGAGANANGLFKWSRVYSVALNAAAMVADAAGTVQANNVLNVDFTTAPTKLANGDTFVCTTGQTVTLNSSGATGARIAGERDEFNATAANRPYYYTKLADGLVFDGTAGATVANVPAFGTADLTVVMSCTINTLASQVAIAGGGTNSLSIAVKTNGTIVTSLENIAPNTESTGTISAGVSSIVVYSRSGTTGTYYINGVAAGTTVDSRNYSAAMSFIGSTINATTAVFPGTVRPLIYNRALSAAEVLALYQAGGVPVAADYNSASNTALNTGTCLNGIAGNNPFDTTFSGASATAFTAAGTAGFHAASADPAFSVTAGMKYLISFTAAITTGTPRIALFNPSVEGISNDGTVSVGANSIVLTATQTNANARLAFFDTIETSFAISDLSITRLGLLLSPDTAQPAAGLKWYDTSGNSATITLPASGVTWSGVATKPGLWFDGIDDYLKSAAYTLGQPTTVYFVGSQWGFTSGRVVFDGDATSSLQMFQDTTTPKVSMYAGTGSGSPSSTEWAAKTKSVVCAIYNSTASLLRINLATAATGDPGTTAANGFTLGTRGSGDVLFSNITASEVMIFSAAHNTATQNRIIQYLGRKHGITV